LNKPAQATTLQASYFDGLVLKGTPVTVEADCGQLVFFLADTQHAIDISNIKRSESFGNAPVVLELPGGATLEFDRQTSLNTLKTWNVLSLSWFEKLQYHPTRWLLITVASLAFAVGVYAQGLPMLSKWIAFATPQATVSTLMEDVLPALDGVIFQPSKLDEKTKAIHLQELESLLQDSENRAELAHVKLVFRSSKIGPNAFALPDGTIVLTDELLSALPAETIPGVLAHELGHVKLRHMTRRLLQNAMVGTLIATFSGDVSILISSLGTQLIAQHYSREFEREADLFAIELFVKQGRELATLELLHEKLGSLGKGESGDTSYLDSHPGADERIELIRSRTLGASI
jgi:Zn-dependent protease with chaperone function